MRNDWQVALQIISSVARKSVAKQAMEQFKPSLKDKEAMRAYSVAIGSTGVAQYTMEQKAKEIDVVYA